LRTCNILGTVKTRLCNISALFCSYADKLRTAGVPAASSAKKPPAAAAAAALPARKSTSSPARKAAASPHLPARSPANSAAAAVGSPSRPTNSKPCPASRKPGAEAADGGAASSPRRSAGLPKGWRVETRTVNEKEVVLYVSPDGKEFQVELIFL
jgi:hypothetical protein